MHRLTFALLLLTAWPAHAQVFRCDTASGTVYQSHPCPQSAQQRELQDRLTVVPASPIQRTTPRSGSTSQNRSAAVVEVQTAEEPKQCPRLRKRIESIDRQARQRSTERLAEERRKVRAQIHELKCSLL